MSNEIKEEVVYDLCAAGLLSLFNHNANTTSHIRQKDAPMELTHEGLTYHYHGTSDGVGFYSTQDQYELSIERMRYSNS